MFKMQVREPQWLPLSSWIGSAFLMFNIKVCIIFETITLIRKPCLLLPQWGIQTLDTSSWIAVCSYFYSDPGHVPCHPHLPSDAGTARPSQIPNLALAIYLDDNKVSSAQLLWTFTETLWMVPYTKWPFLGSCSPVHLTQPSIPPMLQSCVTHSCHLPASAGGPSSSSLPHQKRFPFRVSTCQPSL